MTLSREQMLVEMGISPIWVLRQPAAADQAVSPQEPAADEAAVVPAPAQTEPEPSLATVSANGPTDAAVAPIHDEPPLPDFIEDYEDRERYYEPPGDFHEESAVDRADWPELTKLVAECQLCPLCLQRKQAVLGVGDLKPEWLFIGEGPGAEEDVKGEPFVGQAGKLLDNMLAALDIARGNRVYIANAVKCRPPGNRTPEAAEMAACRPYLARQIALLKPKVIVLLGKAAVHSILGEDKTLGSMRGRRFEYGGIPVIVTYHPAYLLRNLPDKAKAWEDLVFARRLLREQAGAQLPF